MLWDARGVTQREEEGVGVDVGIGVDVDVGIGGCVYVLGRLLTEGGDRGSRAVVKLWMKQ